MKGEPDQTFAVLLPYCGDVSAVLPARLQYELTGRPASLPGPEEGKLA